MRTFTRMQKITSSEKVSIYNNFASSKYIPNFSNFLQTWVSVLDHIIIRLFDKWNKRTQLVRYNPKTLLEKLTVCSVQASNLLETLECHPGKFRAEVQRVQIWLTWTDCNLHWLNMSWMHSVRSNSKLWDRIRIYLQLEKKRKTSGPVIISRCSSNIFVCPLSSKTPVKNEAGSRGAGRLENTFREKIVQSSANIDTW